MAKFVYRANKTTGVRRLLRAVGHWAADGYLLDKGEAEEFTQKLVAAGDEIPMFLASALTEERRRGRPIKRWKLEDFLSLSDARNAFFSRMDELKKADQPAPYQSALSWASENCRVAKLFVSDKTLERHFNRCWPKGE